MSTHVQDTRTPVLSARDLSIAFGRVVGLAGVDLDLYRGEVLAIIGDNGAGKSTLIKCLSGALQPASGTITLDGQVVTFRKPQDARAAHLPTSHSNKLFDAPGALVVSVSRPTRMS